MKKKAFLLMLILSTVILVSCEKSSEVEEVEKHNYLSFLVTASVSGNIQPYDCWVEISQNGNIISSTITINGWYGTGKVDCEDNEEVSIKVYSLYDDSFLVGVNRISPNGDPSWFVETTDLLKTNNSGSFGHIHLGAIN